jgi:hypothetical protein
LETKEMSEYSELQQRFWEYLLAQYRDQRSRLGSNLEAYVFLEILDSTFSAPQHWADGMVAVYREVVQYVAAYGLSHLRGEPECSHIGENKTNLPYLLNRAYDGFFMTIREAVWEGAIQQRGQAWYFGCLGLPDWLVEHFRAEGDAREMRRRELRKDHSPFLRGV